MQRTSLANHNDAEQRVSEAEHRNQLLLLRVEEMQVTTIPIDLRHCE